MVLEFSGFELDLAGFELWRGGDAIKIEPRVLEVLSYLATHRERVVTKNELIEGIWGVKFISESALTRCIHEARRALGDDGPEATIIKTIHGRGYRFIAPVKVDPGASPSRPADDAGTRDVSAGGPSRDNTTPPREGGVAVLPVVGAEPGRSDAARRARLVRWCGLGLIGVALVSALVWWVERRAARTHSGGEAGTSRVSALMQLTAGIQDALKPAYSPDGRSLLFVSQAPDQPGGLDVYLMPATGGAPLRLTSGAGASGDIPVFTADGSKVVFSRFRGGEDGSRLPDLWEVSRFGGQPRLFLEGTSGAGFSADGEWVAYTRYLQSRAPLWISRVNTLDEHRQLAELGFVPRWSPGGEWVAFTTSSPQGGLGHLWLASPSTGELRRLTNEPQQFYGLAWARDGRSVIFAARVSGFFQLWQVGTSGGYMAPLTTGMGEYTSPSVAPDGKSLAFCHSQPLYRLVTVDGLTAAGIREVVQPEHHVAPRLAPTGWRVASAIRRPDFDEALYVTDLVTQKQLRLSDHRARQPCWLSDDEIAYLAPVTGEEGAAVWVVNTATGMRFSWTRLPGDASWLAVNPDKARLAFVSRSPQGDQRVIVRDLSDRQERVIASGAEYECLRWLPGGRALSWSGPVDSGTRESNGIWMAGVDDRRPVHLAPDGYGPVWSDDGRAVHFARFGTHSGLWRLDLDTRELVQLRTWKDVSDFDIVASRLFYIESSGRSQVFSMPLDQ